MSVGRGHSDLEVTRLGLKTGQTDSHKILRRNNLFCRQFQLLLELGCPLRHHALGGENSLTLSSSTSNVTWPSGEVRLAASRRAASPGLRSKTLAIFGRKTQDGSVELRTQSMRLARYSSSRPELLLQRLHVSMVGRFSGYGGSRKTFGGMWSRVPFLPPHCGHHVYCLVSA
jgi:hypothetical protein